MKLLADENIDAGIVGWLREQGHDVLWQTELDAGASDQAVVERAIAERRILVTFDPDFGERVFRNREVIAGVVLLRIQADSAHGLLDVFREAWPRVADRAAGCFVVATNRRIRVRQLPQG